MTPRSFSARGAWRAVFVWCTVAGLGCDDGSSLGNAPDTGPSSSQDASRATDASGPHDAGPPIDASRSAGDAAPPADAATPLDASSPDAAPPLDATAADAATRVDAETADASKTTADAGTEGTFAAVQAIFDERCIGCHDATKVGLPSYAALPLTHDASYAALVSQPAHETCGGVLVKPGKPDESYLIHKTTDNPPCEGMRMPRAFEVGISPPLTDAQHATIRAWIAAGAPR